MLKRIKHQIHNLRQESEEVRMRAATRFTIIGGIVIFILWLVVFLPLQLRVRQQPSEVRPEKVLPQVVTTTEATPTPSVSIRNQIQTPAETPIPSPVVEGLQFLPASEDRLASPTP